jgi:hypothetical protein
MKNLYLPIISLVIFSCVNFYQQSVHIVENQAIENKSHSYRGRGKVSSVGNFKGDLSFSFIAQNDSSFCQFQDFLGRKVLLLWVTPVSMEAWSLIDNKKYDHKNINLIFPILSAINPLHLIYFLVGKEISPKDVQPSNLLDLAITLEKNEADQSVKDTVVLKDKTNNQELSITIVSRFSNKEYVNLKKYWELNLS